MRSIDNAINHYTSSLNTKDVVLLKTCCCAVGGLLGTYVSHKQKGNVRKGCQIIALLCYIPLSYKFFKSFKE